MQSAPLAWIGVKGMFESPIEETTDLRAFRATDNRNYVTLLIVFGRTRLHRLGVLGLHRRFQRFLSFNELSAGMISALLEVKFDV